MKARDWIGSPFTFAVELKIMPGAHSKVPPKNNQDQDERTGAENHRSLAAKTGFAPANLDKMGATVDSKPDSCAGACYV
jgi:hypothetical protein